MQAEGWYVDPYGAHERRWFSDGTPTNLVWDRGVTSRDDPPDFPPPLPLVEVGPVDSGADDLMRADELESLDQSMPDFRRALRGGVAEVFASERARESHFRIRRRGRGNSS